MKKLIILGNGFDLKMGSKTTYSDFKMWISKKDNIFYKMINIDKNKFLWSDFEMNIGLIINNIINQKIEEKFSTLEKMISFKKFDIEKFQKNNFMMFLVDEIILEITILKKYFVQFINESNENINIDDKLKIFDKNITILNFNYTTIAERIFTASEIFYIHGSIKEWNEIFKYKKYEGETRDMRRYHFFLNNKIIFGHDMTTSKIIDMSIEKYIQKWKKIKIIEVFNQQDIVTGVKKYTKEELSKLELIDLLELYIDRNINALPDGLVCRTNGTNLGLLKEVKELKDQKAIKEIKENTIKISKNTSEIWNTLSLNSLNYDKIIIYGHSFSKVDLYYFNKIFSDFNGEIEAYYYSKEDKKRIHEFFSQKKVNIKMLKVTNICY